MQEIEILKTITYYGTDKDLLVYFNELCDNLKFLKNKSIFLIRQSITSKNKTFLTQNEKDAIDYINKGLKEANINRKNTYIKKHGNTKGFKKLDSSFINYNILDAVFKGNNDSLYRNLPVHTAQRVIKKTNESFKSFFNAMKKYDKNKSKFNGRPKLPGYIKEVNNIYFSNISCKAKNNSLIFPGTKLTVDIGKVDNINHVEVIVNDKEYKILVTVKEKISIEQKSNKNYASIDIGVNNLVALATNLSKEKPILIKAKTLKALNQYYNKKIAKLQSESNKRTRQIRRLQSKRYKQIYNLIHSIANRIIDYLLRKDISVLIIGHNTNWKQELNLGKVNNQNFVQLPFNMLINTLVFKCKVNGIECIVREESYTSKASFLDKDKICKSTFSGTRITRGTYKTKKGIYINADVNAACNILVKEKSDAFKCKNFNHLLHTKSFNDKNLLKCVCL